MSLPVDTILGVAGVGVGLPGLVQSILQSTALLRDIYHSYLQGYPDAASSWVILNNLLAWVEEDSEFLTRNSGSLTIDIELRLKGILSELNRSLQNSVEVFNRAIDTEGSVNRLRWATDVKPRLDTLIPHLEAWQRRFNEIVQMLYFTGKCSNRGSTGEISRAERLSSRILQARISETVQDDLEIRPVVDADEWSKAIGQASMKTVLYENGDTGTRCLIERHKYGVESSASEVKAATNLVTRILAAAGMEPQETHLLQAIGYSHCAHPAREIDLVMKCPPNLGAPQSLRKLLDTGMPSVNARLEVARHVATAVFYTHTSGLVHKAICPEAFLVFQNQHEWEYRLAAMHVLASVSTPRGTRYTLGHDIYSLGVNLLEIGIWSSFTCYDTQQEKFVFDDEVLQGGNYICDEIRQGIHNAGYRLKSLYERHANDVLPVYMGRRYRDVVNFCLTIMDDAPGGPKKSLGNGPEEERLGLSYIDKVLGELDEIKV
uniref:Protein kinase domain-containing protein n=1 Tax=Bionectria ochroleuca TaxID=29856 RepID=A0A8H7N3Q4_BIOOC